MRRWFLSLLISIASTASAGTWQAYPSDLPQFDYSGDLLEAHWQELTLISRVDFPSVEHLLDQMKVYPDLALRTLQDAQAPNAHPALHAILEGSFEPLSLAIQEVWRLHYEGHFEEAYELGMQLGPFGKVPAIYALSMYAALMVEDEDKKLELFAASASQSEALLPLSPDYAFGQFGLVYSHARTLELLDTSAARSSGYITSSLEILKDLHERYPNRAIYLGTTGAIQAGIVERVGSFLGRMTYGATESRAIDAFEQALELERSMPVIYNEYTKALARLNNSDFHDHSIELLTTCIGLTPRSAEEALNLRACQRQLDAIQRPKGKP
jgi:hypothetical protein